MAGITLHAVGYVFKYLIYFSCASPVVGVWHWRVKQGN